MKKKKKLNGLDYYVIFSISVLIIYTIVSQYLAVEYSVILDTLTTCVYAAFGGEILAACLIKIFKLKEKDDKPEQEGLG